MVGALVVAACVQEPRPDEKTLGLANNWNLVYSSDVGNGRKVPQRVEGFVCIRPTVHDGSDDAGENSREPKGRTIAEVGNSEAQVKTITVPATFPGCPPRVDASNWLGDDYGGNDYRDSLPDYFFVERTNLTTLTIFRGDNQGNVCCDGIFKCSVFFWFGFRCSRRHIQHQHGCPPIRTCHLPACCFMLTSVCNHHAKPTQLLFLHFL